jgi:superfamily II DNA or RNA helicase
MKSWKHQDIGFERFKDSEYFGLLFDCGTGKTRTAIKIAEHKEMPTIIIAPKNLCLQWADAIKEHGEKESDIFVFNNKYKNKKSYQKALADFLEL